MKTPQSPHLLNDLKVLVQEAKKAAYKQVNVLQTLLYWRMGKRISEDLLGHDRATYGQEVLKHLSDELSYEYGRGFGKRNLHLMVKFYELFPDGEIVQTLSAQLSWSHFVELFKIEDNIKRQFYLQMVNNEGWSVRQLRERIDSMLFERTAISKKPDETIANDLKLLSNTKEMTADLALRDPYLLDFLGLKDTFLEKDLENAILNELQKFILELGSDFAFMARQKRMSIGKDDFYLDLLFYHRKMQRLVAIELKIGEFKHHHKSQMELYLRWLAKYEQQPNENPPIGLILCADKNEEVVELLEMDKEGIHIATYYTELPPKNILLKKLQQAIDNAKKR